MDNARIEAIKAAELSERIIRAFPDMFPDAWKHDKGEWDGWNIVCGKCGDVLQKGAMGEQLVVTPESRKPCTVPTPITLDWNLAMKLVRECNSLAVREQLLEMWLESKITGSYWHWNITHATPTDYAEAAVLCKEQK
jgi:hypothetical protein